MTLWMAYFTIIGGHHAFHFVKSNHTHTITTDAVFGGGEQVDVIMMWVCDKCHINIADPLSHAV